jgi:hypothetical protein
LANLCPFWKNCWQELKEILLSDFYLIKILSWNIFFNLGLPKALAILLKIGEKSVFHSETILKRKLQFCKKFERWIKILFTDWL